MPDFDLTVIGSGPGGYVAAIHQPPAWAPAWPSWSKDADEWGGTCLNHGCIPTKTLVQCAEVLHTVRRAREYGVSVAEPAVDWARCRAARTGSWAACAGACRGC